METKEEAASSPVRAGNPDPVSQSSTVRETSFPANLVSNVPLASSSANLVSHVPLSSSPAMSKLDLGSQTGSVSSSSMVPAPDSCPSSLAMLSVVEQDPVAGTASCSDPVPVLPLPSAMSGSLSTTSHPAPKQGRGRGRKAQTGVEAPRRRGKRQISEAPIGSEVLTDQRPKSAEAPQKKTRVSVSRKATTRNKQEHDTQKQTNVVQTIASPSIINSAIAQVSEDKPEDEAQKIIIHSKASNSVADSHFPPVHGNKQDSKAQRLTDVAQADASQRVADPTMIQTREIWDNKAQNQMSVLQSNVSQNIGNIPVNQFCDSKQENEAEKRTGQCDALIEIANPPIVQENKDEMDNEGQRPEFIQLDLSQIVAHSSVKKTVENQQQNEAEKQIKAIQSDRSQSEADVTRIQVNETEQKNEAHQSALVVESDAAQSGADHPVVQVNKDVQVNDAHGLSNITRQDASQSIAGPSVCEVWDVKQENEVKKQNDDAQTDAFETTVDPAASEVHKAGLEDAATVINGTSCETPVSEAKDTAMTVSGAIVDPVVSDIDRKCKGQSSKDGGDKAGEVLGEQYSIPEEGCVSTWTTMESAALSIDGSFNKSDGLIIERDGNGPEGKETAFENIVAPKQSTVNQSKDGGDEAGELPRNEYSVPVEGCVSTQATMESTASTIDGSLNKSDGLIMEQDVNGLEGKQTAFEVVVAPKQESTINQSFPHNSHSSSPTLEPATTSNSPVSEHENQSREKNAKQENIDCDLDLPVVSDPELAENGNVTEKDGDAPCVPLSVTASVVETQYQSSDDSTVMAISTSVPEASVCENDMCEVLTGNDDIENVEKVKNSLVDGSLHSLLNEGTATVAAEHSEERSDSQSVKIFDQEHEKKECVQSHDPIPVLSTSENVASVNDPALDESEDLFPKGDNFVLLNEDTTPPAAAAASELLEERSDSQCEKIGTQKHGKKECIQSHDPISVLSTSETVTSVSNLSLDKSEDLCQMGDTKEPEKEATVLDEVIESMLESTLGESLHEISSPTLKTLEQVEQKLDSNTAGDMAAEENPNQQKSKDFSAKESLVPKPQVTLVESNSGEVDADIESRDCVMEKILGVTPGSVDNQSLEEITSSICSPFKTESVVVDPALRECKNHDDRKFEGADKTSNASEAFIPKPENFEAETGSSAQCLGTSAELQQDDVEKTSLRTLNTQVECEKGTEEKFEVESSKKITAEVQEYGITEVVSSVEVASETLKMPDEAVVSNAENLETTDGANAGTTEIEAERMDTDMEVDFAVVRPPDLKDGQPEISEVEIGSREEDMEELERRDAVLEKVSFSELEVTGQNVGGTASSTFSILGTEGVDAPILTKESENPSDKGTGAGEDGKASKPDEASVPGSEFCESEGKSIGMEIVAVEEEAALRSSRIEYVVAPTTVKESENQSDKESEEEDRKACNLDETAVPAPEFCESGIKSKGMEIVAGSGPGVEEEAPLKISLMEDVVTAAPVMESEKETGEGEVKEACNPDKASVPRTAFCESGSKFSGMEIVASSGPNVEEEAPLKNSPIEDVVTLTPAKESENQSDKESGGEDKEACNQDKALVIATEFYESGSKSSGMEIVAGSGPSVEEEAPLKNSPIDEVVTVTPAKESENQSDKETEGEDKEACKPDEASVAALCELGSKSSGMEIEPSSEQSIEVEAPLEKSLIEDVVAPNPIIEWEHQSDDEKDAGDGKASNTNEASVPAPDFGVSGSKSAGMETPAGSEQSAGEEAPAAEVETERSGNESSFVSAAEVHGSAEAELDKVVSVAEVDEVQPTVNAGTSEENTDMEQLGGDNSETAADLEVASSASQTTDMKDDLPSSLDNSSKASEIHESPSSAAGMEVCCVPTVNEEKDMQTE